MRTRERVLRLISAFGGVVKDMKELDSNEHTQSRVMVEFTLSDVDLTLSPKNENTTEHLSLPISVHPITLTMYNMSCVVQLYPDYAILFDILVKNESIRPIRQRSIILQRNAFYTLSENSAIVVFDGTKLPDIVHGLEGKYLSLVFDTKIGYLPTFMVEDYNLRFTRPAFVSLPTYDLIREIVHTNNKMGMYSNNDHLKEFLKEKLPEYIDRMPEELRPLARGKGYRII